MNLSLGTNEAVVKSWEYAKVTGALFTKGTSTLTVTNKRVIVTNESKRGLSRDEIAIDRISGISASYYSNFNLLFVLLGVILCCTIILIPIGTRLIQLGIGASLTVTMTGYPTPIYDAIISSSSIRRLRVRKFKLKVNKSAAKEITETLSTIIFVDLKK